MKPIFAILLDSFRMLKSSAIFWVALAITFLVALLYLSIGFNEDGWSMFFGLTSFDAPTLVEGSPGAIRFYAGLFSAIIAEYWLAWVAVALALISCASIFPNALDEGAAGLTLTKKPKRLTVFLSKFVGSLFFVTIQVFIFVCIVFLALKWRTGFWNPSVFWYVPIIVLVFAYLYSFLVLIAVKTKSAMTALLLTLLLWPISSIIGVVEGGLYSQKASEEVAKEQLRNLPVVLEDTSDDQSPDEEANDGEAPEIEDFDTVPLEEISKSQYENSPMKTWRDGLVVAYGFFPKTGRTMEIAHRRVEIEGIDGPLPTGFMDLMLGFDSGNLSTFQKEVNERVANRHSAAYAIGTSSLFAFISLSLAAWIFCRKEI